MQEENILQGKQRIVQELVPGKQVTMAHIIANPNPDIYKKLGLIGEHFGAIGILTITPSEAAIIGADTATKAANVELVSYENVGSTLVTIVVQGDVAACKSAMEAGAKAAASIGRLTASSVIPRPVNAVNHILNVHRIVEEESEECYLKPWNMLSKTECCQIIPPAEKSNFRLHSLIPVHLHG